MIEFNFEVSHNSVQVVSLGRCESVPGRELQVLSPDVLYINVVEQTVSGHDGLGLDDVNNGLRDDSGPDDAHVDAVDVLPELEFLLFVVRVLDAHKVHFGPVGEHEAVRLEPLVPCVEDSVEHAFVEQEVTHPLGDNDVDLVHRQVDLLDLAFDYCDLVREPVVLDYLPRLDRDVGRVHTVHVLGPGSAGEY